MDTGELKPGINADAQGKKSVNAKTGNYTTFGYDREGAPILGEPEYKSIDDKALVIESQGDIPDKKFAVGIGMSGYGTFICQARPNVSAQFDIASDYWIGATKKKILAGQTLNIADSPLQNQKVIFDPHIYSIKYELNQLNKWVKSME